MSVDFTFAFGDANQAFGLPSEGDKELLARRAISDGKLIRKLEETAGPTIGYLIAWPDDFAGLMALVVGRENGKHEFETCWPFANDGLPYRMTVVRIWQDDAKRLTLIEGCIGDLRLTVFDTFCVAATRNVCIGTSETCRIVGWATQLRAADITPDRFHLSDLSPSLQEALKHGLDLDGMVTIDKKGCSILLSASACVSPLYSFRGPIKAARWAGRFMDVPLCILTVTVARPEQADFDLEIFTTVLLLGELKLRIGDDIAGYVWLQASLP